MYEQYYGLCESPFSLTPDTGFFVKTLTHQEALNVLLVALQSGDGFIKLTGEVGTGKTLICRKLLQQLDDNYQTVYIPNPYISCELLLRAVVEEMGLLSRVEGGNYLSVINQQLIQNAQQARRTVILLDEAQSLPVESLEAIRLLSNLETEKSKLVQIVLFGQAELDAKLEDPSIRQLRQRIVHAFELKTLSRAAVACYISQRLRAAGYHGARLFDDKAIDQVFRLSMGVPRLVNLLCHKAMLLGFSSADFYIGSHHVRSAAVDTDQSVGLRTRLSRVQHTAAAVGATLLMLDQLFQVAL